jgi:hypothetical protein
VETFKRYTTFSDVLAQPADAVHIPGNKSPAAVSSGRQLPVQQKQHRIFPFGVTLFVQEGEEEGMELMFRA